MLETIKKILFFFNRQEKKKLCLMLVCIISMGIIEMIGITTVLPFLAVVTKPEIVQSQVYLQTIYNALSFNDTRIFMLFLGGVVFTVLIAGNLFSAFTTQMIIRFCFSHGKKISCELFRKYLSQPYPYFLHNHTSNLSKNILSEIDRVVTGVFLSSLLSITKIVLMLGIFSILLLVDPLLALSAIVILGGSYFSIYFFVRKRLSISGQISAVQNAYRYKLTDEVLASIKELKVLGREKTFLEDYAKSTSLYIRAESLSLLSPLISKYMIEAIAFGGTILIALYLICTQEDISKFMPLLGLYALAGYRLMPAMQQLFTSFSLLRFNLTSLNIVYNEMKLPICDSAEIETSALVEFKHQLELKGISYAYPNSNIASLNNIHLTIPLHSTIGIVGSSGAGKTTLIDIILGLLKPEQGSLVIDGVEINSANLKSWQRNIGYVPQSITLMDTTLAQNIALGIAESEIDHEAVRRAAKLANLDTFVMNELDQNYKTLIGEKGIRLSGGQRQRIGIARALYHDPELLIFDEATSALDGVTEKIIMEAIRDLGHRKTIILIAHRLNTVKHCDEILVLNKGNIVGRGSYMTLMETNPVFKTLASAVVEV